MWNLKYGTNEPICETNRLTAIDDSLGCQKCWGKERDGLGSWD